MAGDNRRNMKHLIKMFEAQKIRAEEEDADIGDIGEITREAYNRAMGRYYTSCQAFLTVLIVFLSACLKGH